MPTGKHEHVKTYDLKQLEQDILNDKLKLKLFGNTAYGKCIANKREF